MKLTQLKLTHFRNLSELHLLPHPRINLIFGPNGSGKTNLLEAIYHLGTGKSFRSTLSNRIIQQGEDNCQVYGVVEKSGFPLAIGIQRHRQAPTSLYLNHQTATNSGELAATFPLRLINPDSFNLLIGGPKYRRHLLNWGVFHVEHPFWNVWRQTNRVLKQRNAALKSRNRKQVCIWDNQLSLLAEQLLGMNQRYFALFEPLFQEIAQQFLPQLPISLKYYPGWDTDTPLTELLEASYPKDQAKGRTQVGPHRADLRIKVKAVAAQDILSRGQQKLVVCALILTQGILLKRHLGKECAYLLDDLAAELDETNLKRVCCLLDEINAQVFLTAVDNKLTEHLFSPEIVKLFHVEQLNPELASTD